MRPEAEAAGYLEAAGSEDEDGHGAVGEDGLVPDALRPGGGGWEGWRRERGFEVDVHVGIWDRSPATFSVTVLSSLLLRRSGS